MKKQMNVGKTIAVIVCALLLVLAVGSIAFFTNGFTSDFKTFYVESDGKRMLSDYDNYIMKQDAENKFVVKYTFGAVNKDISGYTLKIVPNVSHDNDFDFTVDGEIFSFGAEEDLTKGFDITQNENDFVVSGNYTMQSILQRLYPDKEVSFNQDDVDNSVDNFTLLVYSYNGEAVIKICFHNYVAVEGVTLQEQLVFEVQPDGTIKAK